MLQFAMKNNVEEYISYSKLLMNIASFDNLRKATKMAINTPTVFHLRILMTVDEPALILSSLNTYIVNP